MPPLTREQLADRRHARRRTTLRRDRRALVSAAIPVVIVAVLALVLGVMGGGDPDAGPLASPVPSPELGSGARPPELVIARAEGVQVHIPVDPERVTAMAFHPIDDASGVEMEATGGVRIHQAPREGRAGPATAGLDVGAPAGTTVYSPVDGVIASVGDYTLFGKVEGYEVTITPSVAASRPSSQRAHRRPDRRSRAPPGPRAGPGGCARRQWPPSRRRRRRRSGGTPSP